MSKIFKILGFIVGWFAPFVVIYINHVVVVDGYDVDMFGLILVLALLVGMIKWVDKKVELMEIHNSSKIFVLCWKQGKKILLAIGLTWILFTVENNLPKLQLTALLITLCFVGGFVLTLLGNIKKEDTTIK
ncbi:MAG: hypothetical protein GQ557_02215 [Mycoplasmataceae bacterium]|nr:hypothetical protein [Mycoplasmataceae bacterium]